MLRSAVGALAMVVALAACAPAGGAGPSATQAESGGHGAAIGASSSPSFEVVTVKTASYGSLVIETTAGARCGAKAQLPSGGTVLAADFLTDRKVDANGRATWSYATPVAGAGEGSGRYEIACTLGDQTVRASADFQSLKFLAVRRAGVNPVTLHRPERRTAARLLLRNQDGGFAPR